MPDWLEIRVEVAASDGELVADVLHQHCPGGTAIEERRAPAPTDEWYDPNLPQANSSETVIVKGYLPAEEHSRAGRSLRLALSFAPLRREARWLRTRRTSENAWRDGWKRHFRPARLGQRLVVKPSWSNYEPRVGDIVLELDPGMAFGTGQHPTTAMCMRALENAVRPGSRVLDIGTGSGILAIAAARLGAGSVLALDTDTQAVDAARANAAANSVAGIVEVRQTTSDFGELAEIYDVALANISSLFLIRMAARLSASLRPGGCLIASGFLAASGFPTESATAVGEALSGAGFIIDDILEDGDWRTIIARRRQ